MCPQKKLIFAIVEIYDVCTQSFTGIYFFQCSKHFYSVFQMPILQTIFFLHLKEVKSTLCWTWNFNPAALVKISPKSNTNGCFFNLGAKKGLPVKSKHMMKCLIFLSHSEDLNPIGRILKSHILVVTNFQEDHNPTNKNLRGAE